MILVLLNSVFHKLTASSWVLEFKLSTWVRVKYSTCQDSIQVRILDSSIQVKSRCSTQVFKLSQRIEIEYQLKILNSTRQDMKIDK